MAGATGVESKSSQAVRALAELLLGVRQAEQLASRSVLAAQVGVGIGTIGRAFEVLAEAGAIVTRSVQHAGTTVERADYGRLWQLAGHGPVRCILPMPLSLAMEALALAVTKAIQAAGLTASLVYREGALRRLQAVEDREADFTVVSDHAFASQAGACAAVYRFTRGSYYGTSGVYRLRRPEEGPVRRVGADEHSPDHDALVRAEFPGLTAVPAPFRYMPALIASGRLDATVWYGGTAIPVEYVNQLRVEPATSPLLPRMREAQAVVATTAGGGAHHLFEQLDHELLARTYTDVVEHGLSELLSASRP